MFTPIGRRAAGESGGALLRVELLRLDQARAGREGSVGILGIARFPILIALGQSDTGHGHQQQRDQWRFHCSSKHLTIQKMLSPCRLTILQILFNLKVRAHEMS